MVVEVEEEALAAAAAAATADEDDATDAVVDEEDDTRTPFAASEDNKTWGEARRCISMRDRAASIPNDVIRFLDT